MSALQFGAIRLNDVKQQGFAFVSSQDQDKAKLYVVTKPATQENTLLGFKNENTVSVDLFTNVYSKQKDGSYLLKEKDLLNPCARFFTNGQNADVNPVEIAKQDGHSLWIKA